MQATRAWLAGYTLLTCLDLLHCGTLKASDDFTRSDDFDNPAELNFGKTLYVVAIAAGNHFSCFVGSWFHFDFLSKKQVILARHCLLVRLQVSLLTCSTSGVVVYLFNFKIRWLG